MRIPYILIALLVLVGAGVVGYLKYEEQQIDTTWKERVEATLGSLLALDAQINEESMQTRHALNNYDRLARLTGLFIEHNNELQKLFEDQAVDDEELSRALEQFDRSVQTKRDILENFKSHNSLLRNSIRYAPTAGKQLFEATTENQLHQDSQALRNAIDALLSYALIGEEKDAEILRNELRKLNDLDARLPEQNRETVLEFLNHSSTVMKEKDITDVYLGNLLTSKTLVNIVDLERQFSRYLDGLAESQSWFNNALIAFSIALSAGIGILAYQLRKLYRTLDEKVRSRTREIRKAYQSLKDSQEQLVRSEKMASLGQMVAGVAHEINTPLGYVSNNMNVVDRNVDELTPLFNNLEAMHDELSQKKINNSRVVQILKTLTLEYRRIIKSGILDITGNLLKDARFGLEEINRLVESLKDYTRTDNNRSEPVDVNQMLENAVRLCKAHLTKIKVNTDLKEIPEIQAVPSQLNQLFANLLINAAQACESDGGVIDISTRFERGKVEVQVRDNGAGIEEQHLSRIFDPFFTTKDVGQGTGLGLSIAHKIAQLHEGEIKVETTPGRGSTFAVILPRERAELEESNDTDAIVAIGVRA